VPGGPKPIDHQQRQGLAERIADELRDYYKERVQAMGIYGSLGRGTDGPYSDIEMYCILEGQGIEASYEWCEGDWKAEVDIYSLDRLMKWAGQLDGNWSITHGACLAVKPIYDPQGIFQRLSETALTHSEQEFKRLMEDLIVGEIFELVGKLRNLYTLSLSNSMPFFTLHLLWCAACLIGLANRHIYTSATFFLDESLTLPSRPNGYDTLCQMCSAGVLNDPEAIIRAVDSFWLGLESWSSQKGLRIEQEMDTLFKDGSNFD
jgi:kanamycin nucleotidyltransferase